MPVKLGIPGTRGKRKVKVSMGRWVNIKEE